MLEGMAPLLDMGGAVGYAAAYNYRMVNEQVQEYVKTRDDALRELATPVTDDDGHETGEYRFEAGSDAYVEFERRVGELAGFSHDVQLITISKERAIDAGLTGKQMLDADFMFKWDTDKPEED